MSSNVKEIRESRCFASGVAGDHYILTLAGRRLLPVNRASIESRRVAAPANGGNCPVSRRQHLGENIVGHL